MRLPIIEINQNGNTFYLSKIKARDLISISTTKIRKNYSQKEYNNYLEEVDDQISEKIKSKNVWYLKDSKDNIAIQRNKSKERLKEIGEFLSKDNSIVPNTIIISLNRKNRDDDLEEVIKIVSNHIEFDEKNVVATIIDGQHRLGGFNYTDNIDYFLENYELPITILIDLEIALQAELFGVINGKQKAVSKSILYDLSEVSEEEYTETVTAHLIAKWFNVDNSSPLQGKIKMLGHGPGTISQSAFIDALLPLIESKKIKLNDDEIKVLPVFRKYYLKEDIQTIMQRLFDYFSCYEKLFENEWNYILNRADKEKYILNKTTGITGILIAYPTIFSYCYFYNDFSLNFLTNVLIKLKINNFSFSSLKYSGGGKSLQNGLADDILKTLFTNDEMRDVRRNYIKNNINYFE